MSTENTTKYPSFFAQYGRKPIAGQDYDEHGFFCQDDYEYYTGTGRYSDEVKPKNLQGYTEFEKEILALRNNLVSFFSQMGELHGLMAVMGCYSQYCETIDNLDPDNPQHVDRLDNAISMYRTVVIDITCAVLKAKKDGDLTPNQRILAQMKHS